MNNSRADFAGAVIKKCRFFVLIPVICAPAFSEPLEKLASRLQQGLAEYPNIKIAVLEFPYIDGRRSDGPVVVQERLTTLFVKNKKIILIERNLLRKVAGELKLQASGAVDEASTRKMGELIGAEAVLTGTLHDLSDREVEVNARVLLVKTAKIVSAEKIAVKKTWQDAPALRKAAATDTGALVSRLDENARFTFTTLVFKSGRVQRTYFRDKTVIGSDVSGKDGALLKGSGKLPDGFYSEYYPAGALKTEKILINSTEYGSFKTYFPSGVLQNEAYYVAGKPDGAVKIYGETGRPLFEQNFRNGVLDGYFREYNDNGAVKAETFYKDGHVAAPPAEAAEKALTVKPVRLARGWEFSFSEEKKYLCKITTDGEFNILSRQGECPNGTVRAYSRDGKQEKEFVFSGNKLASLMIFNEDGSAAAEKNYAP